MSCTSSIGLPTLSTNAGKSCCWPPLPSAWALSRCWPTSKIFGWLKACPSTHRHGFVTTPWRAAPDWETLRRRGASWFLAVPGIRQVLRSHGRGGILAGFVAEERVSGERSIDELLALSARKAADDLLEALPSDDEATLTRSAYGLAGLGQGGTA